MTVLTSCLLLMFWSGPVTRNQTPAPPLEATGEVVAPAPPTVVRTEPPSGSAGLDPAEVREFRVVFDQPMSPGGFSFTGGGPTFPEIPSRPTYVDPRTAVLPVALKPDTDYMIGVNSVDFRNFRSADGTRAATPRTVVFSTRPWPLDDATRAAAIHRLRDLLPGAYSYASRLGIDWSARLDALEPAFLAADNELRLAVLVQELMDAAEDPHVWVRLGETFPIPSNWWSTRSDGRDLRPNVSRRGLSAALTRLEAPIVRHEAGIVTARLSPTVGYMLVPTWSRDVAPGAAALAALDSLRDVEALILDVRENGGGDELEARTLAACFTDEPVVYAARRHVEQVPVATGDDADGEPPSRTIGPPRHAVLEPAEAELRFPGRVVVLTGPGVMSSNEAFVLMMRAAGAVLVGAPTRGSSGRPVEHSITPNIRLWLPSWVALDASERPFEGIGIAPDVEVKVDPAMLQRGDPVLERGLEVLLDR